MKIEKAKVQLRIMLTGPAASYMTHSPAIKKVLDELEAKDKRIAELEAREVQLPVGYELRYGHPINADGRHIMIPKENGSWLYLADLEHALRVAGIRIKGERCGNKTRR
ncbi:hypothetical protein IUC14_005125 [Escherichia coli]|nr:hypothetical protein [Escherichia coli]